MTIVFGTLSETFLLLIFFSLREEFFSQCKRIEGATTEILNDLDRNDQLGTLSRILCIMINFYLKSTQEFIKSSEIPLTNLLEHLLDDHQQGNLHKFFPYSSLLAGSEFVKEFFCCFRWFLTPHTLLTFLISR